MPFGIVSSLSKRYYVNTLRDKYMLCDFEEIISPEMSFFEIYDNKLLKKNHLT